MTVVGDIGSGLLAPEPLLSEEPAAASWLAAGAGLVTASGDKLLGGPQCGLLLGRAEIVERLRRHPLARALRVDKLTLAALEATLRGPATPTYRFLHADPAELRDRAARLAARLRAEGIEATAVASEATVGGGARRACRCPALPSPSPTPWPSGCASARPPCWRESSASAACSTCERSRRKTTRPWPRPYGKPHGRGERACTSSPPRGTSTTASPRWYAL